LPVIQPGRLFHIYALKAVTVHNVGMDQEPPLIIHAPGCGLDSVHFLRHAAAAVGMLTHDKPEGGVDRVSAEALADSLARFAEQDDWATVSFFSVAAPG
jgi:hypothetical protein